MYTPFKKKIGFVTSKKCLETEMALELLVYELHNNYVIWFLQWYYYLQLIYNAG